MKRICRYLIQILTITLICVRISHAQLDWYWQNPLPQGNTLYGVSFTDANTGTAVGGMCTILRTTNGGANWISQSSGTIEWLRGVSFTDANTGTVVGSGGTILRTTNGGANWISQSSGTTNILYGVSFTDANTGTAVGDGGYIIHTTNGGTTWTSQPSGATTGLMAVSSLPMPTRVLLLDIMEQLSIRQMEVQPG